MPPLTPFTCLLYVREIFDKIKRILNEIGVKVAVKHYFTIGNFSLSPKDSLNERDISGIPYTSSVYDPEFIKH